MTAERSAFRVLGLDPGLRATGWGVIDVSGNRLSHVADGVIASTEDTPTAARLVELFRGIAAVIELFSPDHAAVEETFVNKNATTTLKLGLARGVALLVPAERGIEVAEYAANLVKKSVVGVGHAEKSQIQMMVRRLLPGCLIASADAADALAVAICHAHHAQTKAAWRALSPRLPPQGGEGKRGAAVHTEGVPLPVGERLGEGAVPQRTRNPADVQSGSLIEAAKRKPTIEETARARRLRRDSTNVERILWRHLRNRQLEGVKFRRQEPILHFIADFVAHERKLIIELDGGQHDARSDQDAKRTALLERAGFRVLRFWNNDVSENLEGVIETIQAAVKAAPSPCPSPQGGEGTRGAAEKRASR